MGYFHKDKFETFEEFEEQAKSFFEETGSHCTYTIEYGDGCKDMFIYDEESEKIMLIWDNHRSFDYINNKRSLMDLQELDFEYYQTQKNIKKTSFYTHIEYFYQDN